MSRFLCLGLLACVGASVQAAPNWETVPMLDGDLHARQPGMRRAYGGATLEDVAGPEGCKALRVNVAKGLQGGLSITATPRGGMGNRLRLTITYRVVAGPPVLMFFGPNTFNQSARLASRQWETATLELGLLSDFHLIVHMVQSGPGTLELSEFKVEARPPEKPLSPARIGTVDLAMEGHSSSDPALGLERFGNPLPLVDKRKLDQDPAAYQATIAKGTGGRIVQGLGTLPAGTRISLQGRLRVAGGGPVVFGLQCDGRTVAEGTTAASDWTPLAVNHRLERDGRVTWFARPAASGPAEFWFSDVHAWGELPDPLAPGAVKVDAARRPIRIAMGDAKSLRITPPWPQIPPLMCHLEYNSRWGFRFPTSHEAKLSAENDALDLTWHFQDDPVTYGLHMKSDRPESVLVEARLHNAGKQQVAGFTPGFCLQLAGAYSPTTFAYTIIPRAGDPFPLSAGRYFADRPAMWANVGWVRADFTGSAAYAERVKQGSAFKPSAARWIHETGDFPLLARRLPGRDAWIAWIWPNATGYFGNTQTPCMHMDPVLPDCPAGQTRSLFGRLLFFEGSWEKLYALAERERRQLGARSGLPGAASDTGRHDPLNALHASGNLKAGLQHVGVHAVACPPNQSTSSDAGPGERKTVRIAGIVLKWIRTDKEANFRRAEALIRQAAAGGARIVCTTECFLDGYAIADKSIPLETYRALGEPIPDGPYCKRLAALAAELKVHLVAGMLEADGKARCNTAAVISPEGCLLGKYRKQHLEHELVRNQAGSAAPVFPTPYGRMGIMICADRRLPEIAGRLKQQGAGFLLCLSGGMFGPKSNDWILQARSRETGLPIVFVHPAEFLATGPDGSILDRTILGDSLLIAPTETGTPKDQNRVFYFDLERTSR